MSGNTAFMLWTMFVFNTGWWGHWLARKYIERQRDVVSSPMEGS